MKTKEYHSRTHTPEYFVWDGIIQRTTNPNNTAYHNYGGRGVVICQKWRDSFQAFFDHVGKRPTSSHTIDRINNELGYEPGNVRWVLRRTQILNRRLDDRNISGVSGVTWDRSRNKWKAQITINRQIMMLGRFKTLKDAIKARRDAEERFDYWAEKDRPEESQPTQTCSCPTCGDRHIRTERLTP